MLIEQECSLGSTTSESHSAWRFERWRSIMKLSRPSYREKGIPFFLDEEYLAGSGRGKHVSLGATRSGFLLHYRWMLWMAGLSTSPLCLKLSMWLPNLSNLGLCRRKERPYQSWASQTFIANQSLSATLKSKDIDPKIELNYLSFR